MTRTLDIGVPSPSWRDAVKGQPIAMITTQDANANLDKAPSDGKYTGPDGVPHKIRKGDPIPEGATFSGNGGDAAETAPAEEQAADAAPTKAKGGKFGPSETTEAAGPSEKG